MIRHQMGQSISIYYFETRKNNSKMKHKSKVIFVDKKDWYSALIKKL